MKLKDLKTANEMTITYGQFDKNTGNNILQLINNGSHVGDVDGRPIIRTEVNGILLYGIKDQDNPAAVCSFLPISQTVWEWQVAFTSVEHRRQGMIARILWFVKDQEKKSILDYGAHSQDAVEMLKSLAKTNRFNMFWFNTETKEKVQYDPQQDNNTRFTSLVKRTPWRILIENNENPTFPRFDKSTTFPWGNPHVLFE